MRYRPLVLVCVVSLLLGGCIGHYRYESKGSVTTTSSGTTNALLYWYADDGRLWYGKRYQAVNSGLTMKVCRGTPKLFDSVGEENVTLQLPSKPGDRKIAKVDRNEGTVVPLPEPERLDPGSTCGHILISGKAASMENLTVGEKPEVIILCESQRNPDRYPAVGRYAFTPITKTEVDGNEPPASVCPSL